MIRKFCDRCAKEIKGVNYEVSINITGNIKYQNNLMLCDSCQKELDKVIKEYFKK